MRRSLRVSRVPDCTLNQIAISDSSERWRHDEINHLFLIGYFILVVGVALALWQTGILNRVAPIWIAIGLISAVGVGVMASVSSGQRAIVKSV
jgi:hypothetical protein